MTRRVLVIGLHCTFLLSGLPFPGSAAPETLVYGTYGEWDSAKEVTVGIQSPWPIAREAGRWIVAFDAELGLWVTKQYGQRLRRSTEFALGPAVRYYFDGRRHWYVEAVTNVAVVLPEYWRGAEHQGTAFELAGGFSIGYRFGVRNGNEISFGAEHFSDAGTAEPNPGRNFFQLRYARAFE